jgi:hypothetical protein
MKQREFGVGVSGSLPSYGDLLNSVDAFIWLDLTLLST